MPSNATNDTFISSPSPSYTSTNDTLPSSSPTSDMLSSNTSTAITISIPGNLTLTNLVYPPKTQEERTLIITVLEDIIQDVATKVLEKSDEEDVIIREVVILSINGEDVIVKEEEENGEEEVSQRRELQESTNGTVVEFDLKLEEPCTEDVPTCEDLVDTTMTYYEEIVAPYMTEQVADGSFTTALQDNVQQNDETSESDLFQDVEIVDGEFGVKVAMIDDDINVPNNNSTTVVNADVMGVNGTSTSTSLMTEVSNIPTISPSSSSTTDTTPSPSVMGGSNSSLSALPTPSDTSASTRNSPTSSPSSKSSTNSTEMSLTSPPSPSPSKSLVTSEPTTSLTSSPPYSAEPTDSSSTVEPTDSSSTAGPTILSNANTNPPTSNPSETLSSLAPTAPPNSNMIPSASPVFNPILEFTISLLIEGTGDAAQFGFATAYSDDGSTLAVGSPAALNELGEATGAVYLYSLDTFTSASTEDEPTVEEVTQPEILYGVSPGDEFGHAVAISRDGKTLVVGSPSENELAGGVRIYVKRGGRFALNGEFSGDFAEDQAGWSVSVSVCDYVPLFYMDMW